MLYRSITSAIEPVGELEFRGIAATSALLSDGYELVMAGADLSRFAAGRGPLLYQHDPSNVLGVITRTWTTVGKLMFQARFASPGISPMIDEKRKLLKDGALNSISCGFDIQQSEAIPGKRGRRCTSWCLLEVSVVSVPLDQAAQVTERSRGSSNRARRLAEVRALAPPAGSQDPRTWSDQLLRRAEVERLRRIGELGRHQLISRRERLDEVRRLRTAP